MSDVLSWLVANWTTVVGTAGTVVLGASIIVRALSKFTDTTKDDEAAGWLEKVYKWLNTVAINTPPPQ